MTNGGSQVRRVRATTATAVALAATLAATAPAAEAADTAEDAGRKRCRDVVRIPTTAAELERAADGLVCVINRRRVAEGLRPLRVNAKLTRSATRHAIAMVRGRYFAHVARNGSTPTMRIRRTGYTISARRWLVGENIAWGTGRRATTLAIHRALMDSPGHRRNLLRPGYREIGIGVVDRAPNGRRGVTLTQNFGATKR